MPAIGDKAPMKIAIAQVRFPVGDFDGNSRRVLDIINKARAQSSDLIVFPEGGIWGYPPKDFLRHDHFFDIQGQKLRQIKKQLKTALLLGAFAKSKGHLQNGAFLFEKGGRQRFFAKEFLPDQGVFCESRYFAKGRVERNVFSLKGKNIQILICEDLWHVRPLRDADLLIAINASPYTDTKQKARLARFRQLARQSSCPALYVNCVGAQDGLIFDGGSFALDQKGAVLWQGAFFEPDFEVLTFAIAPAPASASAFAAQKGRLALKAGALKALEARKKKKPRPFLKREAQREKALILGIREFFLQAGFSKAVVGLSGGIDSALTACLAVQALGSENVLACFLPGPYTRALSGDLARQTALKLKTSLHEQSISPLFERFSQVLAPPKGKWQSPLSPQNLQSRIRALFLSALADESKALMLSTSNKSETAVGYSTLYGDLSGALCPVGDMFKTELYALARFINKRERLFPSALFSRAPSAELCHDQKDQDDLPPYSRLDPILKRLLRGDRPVSSEERKLSLRIQKQEFKRAQAPPILKISDGDLGESWKKPIVGAFPP